MMETKIKVRYHTKDNVEGYSYKNFQSKHLSLALLVIGVVINYATIVPSYINCSNMLKLNIFEESSF
jgi:hypothetical protein